MFVLPGMIRKLMLVQELVAYLVQEVAFTTRSLMKCSLVPVCSFSPRFHFNEVGNFMCICRILPEKTRKAIKAADSNSGDFKRALD